MSYTLEIIDNFESLECLYPGDENQQFIEHIPDTVREIKSKFPALYHEYLKAICFEQKRIGFTAFYPTRLLGEDVWFVHTFMIDHLYQGSGNGRHAFQTLLCHFDRIDPNRSRPIELASSNPIALRMYRKFGFHEAQEPRLSEYARRFNEILMRLDGEPARQ